MINQLIVIADSIMPNKPRDMNDDGCRFVFEMMLMRLDSKLSGHAEVYDLEMRCFLQENSPIDQEQHPIKSQAESFNESMDAFGDAFIKVAQQSEPWSDVLGEVYHGLGFRPAYHKDTKQLSYNDPCEQGLRTIVHIGAGANKTILEALSKEERIDELRVLGFANDFIEAQMLAIQLMVYSRSAHGHNSFGEVAVGVLDPEANGSIDVFFSQHNPRIIPINVKNNDEPSKMVH